MSPERDEILLISHCVKSVPVRSFSSLYFSQVAGKYRPVKLQIRALFTQF